MFTFKMSPELVTLKRQYNHTEHSEVSLSTHGDRPFAEFIQGVTDMLSVATEGSQERVTTQVAPSGQKARGKHAHWYTQTSANDRIANTLRI